MHVRLITAALFVIFMFAVNAISANVTIDAQKDVCRGTASCATESQNETDDFLTLIVPWQNEISSLGGYIGSSFVVALKRLRYNIRWSLLTVNCRQQFYTISSVCVYIDAFSRPSLFKLCCSSVNLVKEETDIHLFVTQ